ncbi:MAG: DUF1684 domain-containing protein [Candidatus Levybacteria bacterium]|nr:DUF1684 domain-containing protein [Candidatus Daviesbacteria bacterium]MBI4078849.1 DUF1684 domain-containing protein [Candidatus Levybacteria bacterium]
MYDEKKLLEFRKQKDEAWKNDKESPLTEEQRRDFKGLDYFPANPDLSFELTLDKNLPDVGKEVIIKTTGGEEQVYLRAGKITFTVEGKEIEALVFEDPEQEQFQYYLLFRDKTTGKETYKNGRMLQIPKKALRHSSGQGDKLVIDFNYAYNPYSSYNDRWDCPITPEENVLPIPIKAGERKLK